MKIQILPQKYINVVLICLFIFVFSFSLYKQNSDSTNVQNTYFLLDTTMRISGNHETIREQIVPVVQMQNNCIHKNDTSGDDPEFTKLAEKTGGYIQEDYR